MLSDLPKPAIISHRGASAYAPENTLPAFQQALDQHADGIELDVTLSADGQVVVIHDATIDRTTDGEGQVKQMDYEAIKQFDAGSWFGPAFEDTHVPTLDEVLALVGDRIFTNVEIKPFYSPMDDLVEKVAAVVSRHNLENKIIFSSFNPWALTKMNKRLPKVPLGFLLMPGLVGNLSNSLFGNKTPFAAVHPHFGAVSPKMIARARQKGMRVFAWTVNTPEEMRRLFNLGVDGIITDDPQLAMNVRAEIQ